jgi:hypothetical protein
VVLVPPRHRSGSPPTLRSRWITRLGFLATASIVCLAPDPADAERTQRGDLVVALNARVSPLQLPRRRPAPVALHVSGRIQTADRSTLPRVKRIGLSLGGRGRLHAHGLPVCPRARLRTASTRQAFDRCRSALVGTGHIGATVYLPRQAPFPIRGRTLAFNGRAKRGGPAVWVHAFAGSPPVSIVLPFLVHRDARTLATTLTLTIPESVGPWPRLARFDLNLFRRYRHRGRLHSYLSASCPIPSAFTAGFLAFAKARYDFADGRRLRVEAVRSCRAR